MPRRLSMSHWAAWRGDGCDGVDWDLRVAVRSRLVRTTAPLSLSERVAAAAKAAAIKEQEQRCFRATKIPSTCLRFQEEADNWAENQNAGAFGGTVLSIAYFVQWQKQTAAI